MKRLENIIDGVMLIFFALFLNATITPVVGIDVEGQDKTLWYVFGILSLGWLYAKLTFVPKIIT